MIGVSHYLKNIDREETIHIGVWEGGSHVNGVLCYEFVHFGHVRNGWCEAKLDHQLKSDDPLDGCHAFIYTSPKLNPTILVLFDELTGSTK